MALWSVNGSSKSDSITCKNTTGDDNVINLAECVPIMEPIFHFSNLCLEPHTLTSAGERVRSLAYNSHSYVSC